MTKALFSGCLALFVGSVLLYFLGSSPAVWAEATSTGLRKVRTIETDDLFNEEFFIAGNPKLPGVGFPPGAHTLLILNQPEAMGASVALVAPPKDKKSKISQTLFKISDPINLAFDSVSQGAKGFGIYRLFLWDSQRGQLIAIKTGPRDVMDSAKIRRFDVQGLRITDPQGMTLNPTREGRLFVLDSAGARIVGITPKPGREFAGAKVSEISLPSGLGELRGLAFNPANRHLYVMSTEQEKLYELTLEGEMVAVIDLAGLELGIPQGMVFAPSLDLTDHPSIFHLYLVTAQGPNGELTEWALPESF